MTASTSRRYGCQSFMSVISATKDVVGDDALSTPNTAWNCARCVATVAATLGPDDPVTSSFRLSATTLRAVYTRDVAQCMWNLSHKNCKSPTFTRFPATFRLKIPAKWRCASKCAGAVRDTARPQFQTPWYHPARVLPQRRRQTCRSVPARLVT